MLINENCPLSKYIWNYYTSSPKDREHIDLVLYWKMVSQEGNLLYDLRIR